MHTIDFIKNKSYYVREVCIEFTLYQYLQEDEKPVALGIGLCLATGGIALIAITNVINKIEHDRILRYLEMKVEELRYHENFGKMPNHTEASYLVPAEETPPV